MSRLSQMLASEQIRRGMNERQISAEFGWAQQTFNKWKAGKVPRAQFHGKLAKFLQINVDQVAELADEAVMSSESTKLPKLAPLLRGHGTPDNIRLTKFGSGFAVPDVSDCYAITVDGHLMWVRQKANPEPGNTVLVRTEAKGRLATWPVTLAEGEIAHLVVLQELI